MNKQREGIIKINPYRFQPIISYNNGFIKNVSIDVSKKQIDYAYDNMGKEVIFYINKKDFGVIKTQQ